MEIPDGNPPVGRLFGPSIFLFWLISLLSGTCVEQDPQRGSAKSGFILNSLF